ncbi:MAG: hypothetical protein RMA76_45960 [Deltaproteobacteria bacterium]|jgi:hypothetical protein
MKKKLGELLLERRVITPAQLSDALTLQRRNGMRLGAALIARGHLEEKELVAALASLFNVQAVDLSQVEPDPEALSRVRRGFASEHDLFPYRLERIRGRTVLTVAMSDPLDVRVIDELGFVADVTIHATIAGASDIDMAIRHYYGARLEDPNRHRAAAVRLNTDIPQMTILRPGGGEEQVNTETGPIPTPFVDTSDVPKPAPPRDDSALLLTEEVSDSTPLSAESPLTSPPTSPPIPLTSVKRQPNPPRPEFDASLGALIDAAGDAVNAEAFQRLERKFWALMRVLAKKGVLTNEDFLAELRDD